MKEKNNKSKILKKILIVIPIICVVSIVATIGIGNYFVNYAIKRYFRKFCIKNETFCFFYLTIIIIFYCYKCKKDRCLTRLFIP